MNNAEFKDMVMGAIDKLEEQDSPSKTSYGACLYLNTETKHCCIVGHMMPDDHTRKIADTYSDSAVTDLFQQGFEWLQQFTAQQLNMLQELQKLHDDVLLDEPVIEACQKMRKLVEKFN